MIGLFEALETIRQTLARILIKLLDQYGLRKKIITHVKNESLNINPITNAFKFFVCYDIFGFEENFQGSYFGHAFSKFVNLR
jgi:hypothetical protein